MFKKKSLRIISKYRHPHNARPCQLSVFPFSNRQLSAVSFIYRRWSLIGTPFRCSNKRGSGFRDSLACFSKRFTGDHFSKRDQEANKMRYFRFRFQKNTSWSMF